MSTYDDKINSIDKRLCTLEALQEERYKSLKEITDTQWKEINYLSKNITDKFIALDTRINNLKDDLKDDVDNKFREVRQLVFKSVGLGSVIIGATIYIIDLLIK